MARSVRDLARDTRALASLPDVYTRLTEALAKPRVSTGQIADIIASDPALTARLLRLVNSAFYAFSARIETVQHAVFLVGTQQIQDLALATSVLRVFSGISRELVDMESFWRHSIATGVTARALATYKNERGTERFFVAGILHDVGRLLCYVTQPEAARASLQRSQTEGEALVVAERAVLGYDHAEAGGALLAAWHLPEDLQEMVQCHHAPTDAKRYAHEAAVVHVADIVATSMELGNSGDPAVPPLTPGAWEQLGLVPVVLGALTEHVERQVNEVVQSILTS